MNWNHAPLAERSTAHRASIVRVPAGANWRILCTATRFACRHQHWGGGRTVPCLYPESPCPWCERGEGKWLTAFLGCWNLSRQCPMVLALPEEPYVKIQALLGDELDGGLRGRRLEIRRPGTSKRGKIEIDLLGREEEPGAVPPGLQVPAILFRCWGLPANRYRVAAGLPPS